MRTSFHNKPFDEGTKIKLEIFRRYLREWIPVFLTVSPDTSWCTQVNIFDLFCGPGKDLEGTPGSPLIIQEEIKSYCQKNRSLKKDIVVKLFFNDRQGEYIEVLKKEIENNRCPEACCKFSYHTVEFGLVVEELLPVMEKSGSANLLLLDQFGVKNISPELVTKLLRAGASDVLFFISSSAIRRFAEESAFKEMFPGKDIKSVEYDVIHRYLTGCFRDTAQLPDAYFAPFSIKKGSNIYGLIFATRHELGIEKFLRVCWDLDSATGEANYNIDGDVAWGNQPALFSEMNVPTKKQVFRKELLEHIIQYSPTNRNVYRFGLREGFPSRECAATLKELQNDGKIKTEFLNKHGMPRKGTFYLKKKKDIIRIVGRSTNGDQ